MRLLFFFVFFLTFFPVIAQQRVDYVGLLALQDSTFISYKLELVETDGILKGFSYTDLNGPHESKNTLVGRYNSKDNKIEFREVDIVYTKSPIKELDFCFVYFTGSLRNLRGKATLEGNFKSYYDDLQPCIDGKLIMQGEEKFTRKTEKITSRVEKMDKIPDSVKQRIANSKFLNSSERQGLKGGETLNVFWESKTAYLEIWDPGKVDGDAMSIVLNGKVVKENYAPLKAKTKIPLTFNKEINTLVLKALSEGTDPPNTAQIRITDGNGKEISMLSSFKVGEQVKVVFYQKDLK
ncbi:hypothetical protein SAMN05192588_0179 [Nonlabens sp. Hel1_33_55]|uniref:hypothetical protein n=1 Tax=Nonlabens sp. Hel1_33_55 TaxID=1336802 RepID=UPI000875AA26|nr:hypothetical protein [Nonlabens sp. Hel1_33_55]SCX90134.1 hypothetical protein SAMN05192588_0179 [Nonlabens sp. Hel1_33_55]